MASRKEFDKKNGEEKAKREVDAAVTFVLKLDLHCEGCAVKLSRSIKGLEGVEVVNIDRSNGELTVMGVIDLLELRKRVENITGKKVSAEILENTSPSKYHLNRKTADRKSKVVSTAVLEIPLHCRGCIQRIRKYISKIDGVKVVSFNWNKDVVTVSGTVDMETVAEMLRRKLRRSVEISESKEEDDEKKEGEKKDERRAADATEFNGYGNGKQLQGYRVELGQPRLFFSDENPYACSVM